MTQQELHQSCVTTNHASSMDAVQTANYGHPVMLQGHDRAVHRMRSFSAPAPLKDLQLRFGSTVAQVVEVARQQLRQAR